MYFLTKKFSFDAAHKLEGYNGKCSNLHGHLYACEFTVCGNGLNLSRDIAMLIDFKDMKRIAEDIVDCYDHTYLNETMQSSAPTAEIIAYIIYNQISKYINLFNNVFLHSVKVWETPDNCVEYVGNDTEEFLVRRIKAEIK